MYLCSMLFIKRSTRRSILTAQTSVFRASTSRTSQDNNNLENNYRQKVNFTWADFPEINAVPAGIAFLMISKAPAQPFEIPVTENTRL